MSGFRLHIKGFIFSKEDILHTQNASIDDAHVSEILTLCRQWLTGKEWFELKTSGSTGVPKIITIQRAQIEASAQATLNFFDLTAGDKVVCPLSIHVIGGQMMLYRSLIGELDLYVIPADRTLHYLDTSLEYAFMPLSAVQLYEVLSNEPEKIPILNRLKNLLVGGSSVSDTLQTLITTKLTCNVWQSYGMTETVSHIAMRQLNPVVEESYTLFEGIAIALDERSCLKIKGAVTGNTWIQTNDCVELTNSNHIIFLGRTDFCINSGGIKIQAEPIEKTIELLLTQLHIQVPFFVGGVPDVALGEKLVLVIDSTAAISDEDKKQLLEKLKIQLPKYHAPKEIVSIPFEYTPSGKINRKGTLKKRSAE